MGSVDRDVRMHYEGMRESLSGERMRQDIGAIWVHFPGLQSGPILGPKGYGYAQRFGLYACRIQTRSLC
jgi:hypothetical protein